jgi:putative NAD(P)-binding protein
LAAGGQIARWVIEMLANGRDVNLTLFFGTPESSAKPCRGNAQIVQGDVLNKEQLSQTLAGQDLLYANPDR